MKAALIQQIHGPDKAANLRRSETAVRAAVTAGAELIALSELHATPYFCQTEDPAAFDLAEPIPGPATEWLAALSRELSVVVVGSVFERRAAGLYHNTAVVFERDGTMAGRYRKMHIPDDPGYYEKFYFTPATWASPPSARRPASSACSSAGTSGIRRPPASWPWLAPRCSSTRPPSAGRPLTRHLRGNANSMPGSTSSGLTPWPMDCRF